MPRKSIRTLFLAGALSLAAAVGAEETPPPVPLVKLDGFAVTNLHLALFGSQTGRSPQDAEGQIAMLNELVNNFMVANSAQGQALAAQPEVAAALEVARARLIAQTFVRQQLRDLSIDEATVRQIYDAEYANAGGREFKARHILVETQEEAQAVIAELDKGADFATLASERSIGPSKSVGGDLGWFEAGQMVPAFSAATAELADGSYSKTPVKTQFGWHVILREASREVPPPALDTVRAEIEQQIRQQQVAEEIGRIRENTRIEVQELD